MTKDRVMPLGLMIYTLKRIFNRLNPDGDEDEIDWENTIDYPISFESALHDMETEYPQYVWFEANDFETREREKEMEERIFINSLIEKGYDEETIDRIVEERDFQVLKGGWEAETIDGQRIYTKTVRVKPHLKGKHMRGRIQVTCDPELMFCEAKITIVKSERTNVNQTEG